MRSEMGKIIGIDLGTTNSVVSIIEGGTPKIITNVEGSRTTPSVVAFTSKGERLVGQVAKRQAVTNSTNTIFSSKRFIGQTFASCAEEIKRVPYDVVASDEGYCLFQVGDKKISPEEIASIILSKLKKDATAYLGYEVTDAVITVPAYFNDAQRQATKDAGKIAGLNVKRIINEPTAAALAYKINKNENKKIVVFDFGGGTFDVSVLEVADEIVEVKSTKGDTQLGGDDVDTAILNWIIEEYKKEIGADLLSNDKMAIQRLRESAEKAKVELSTLKESKIDIPFITADANGPKHLSMTLSRSQLDRLIGDIVQKTITICQEALSDIDLSPSDMDEVLLVGGSTRIVLVRDKVKEFFGRVSNTSVNPDEAVALGAAVQAGILSNDVKDVLLLDVTSLSLGIETLGGVMTNLIERNTTIPVKKSKVFSTAEDNQPNVTISVLQGERKMATDNQPLGRFDLVGIPPAPRGVPQIEVTFDIDADGIIHVKAKDLSSKKEHSVKIDRPGMDQGEVEKLIKEAQSHEGEDKKRQDRIEVINKLDQMIYQLESLITKNKDKIDEATQKQISDLVAKKKEDLKNESLDTSALEKSCSELEAKLKEIGEVIYKKMQQSKSAEAPKKDEATTEDNKDKKVVDTEFKDVGE